MITDAILGFLAAILEPIVNALPHGTSPWDVNNTAGQIAKYTAPINAVVPIFGPLNAIVKVIAVTFPALLTYRIGLWLYNRIRG